MGSSLDGKVAIVTGAASGIGRATAIMFAEKGASVVVSDLDREGGEETVEMIGDRAAFIHTDVASEESVRNLVAGTVERFGRLDAAHNNAAVADVHVPLHTLTEEQWDRLADVDLKGVWLCMKHQIAHMLEHGGGSIVNTSSALALLAIPHQATYCAAKAGVLSLTRAAAAEYSSSGIRINAVLPGIISTPMVEMAIASDPGPLQASIDAHPIGRIGRPEEIAAAVTWLCSDAASFVTGHSMSVDGGFVVTGISSPQRPAASASSST